MAVQLPRTAAAMLKLDYAHRVLSPLNTLRRAHLRWIVANENRCEYSKAVATADLQRAGGSVDQLTDPKSLPVKHRGAIEFVRLLAVAAPTIPDSLFEDLRSKFDDWQVAAMVLLAPTSSPMMTTGIP